VKTAPQTHLAVIHSGALEPSPREPLSQVRLELGKTARAMILDLDVFAYDRKTE